MTSSEPWTYSPQLAVSSIPYTHSCSIWRPMPWWKVFCITYEVRKTQWLQFPNPQAFINLNLQNVSFTELNITRTRLCLERVPNQTDNMLFMLLKTLLPTSFLITNDKTTQGQAARIQLLDQQERYTLFLHPHSRKQQEGRLGILSILSIHPAQRRYCWFCSFLKWFMRGGGAPCLVLGKWVDSYNHQPSFANLWVVQYGAVYMGDTQIFPFPDVNTHHLEK